MRKIVVANHVTLDGVMQSPSGPDEDPSNDFTHGGWAGPRVDDVLIGKMGESMGTSDTLLFGRRTYEHFASYWPAQTDGNPYHRGVEPARQVRRLRPHCPSRCRGRTRRC